MIEQNKEIRVFFAKKGWSFPMSTIVTLSVCLLLTLIPSLVILLHKSDPKKSLPLTIMAIVFTGISCIGGFVATKFIGLQIMLGPIELFSQILSILASVILSLFFKKFFAGKADESAAAETQDGSGQPAPKKNAKFGLLITVAVLAVALVGVMALAGGGEETFTVGQVCGPDGINFILYECYLSERIDKDTLDPKTIDDEGWNAEEGNIFTYLNYRVINHLDYTINLHTDVNIYAEFRGERYGNYRVSSQGEDPADMDVAPNQDKSCHFVFYDMTEELRDAEPGEKLRILVDFQGKTFVYEIPVYELEVCKAEEVQGNGSGFVKADASTEQNVRQILNNSKGYTWQSGNVKCRLSFTDTEASLEQTLAGSTYTVSGPYEVGTEYLKVNYGGGDVYYRWDYNENGHLNLYLVD